jgi:hypothetical protein
MFFSLKLEPFSIAVEIREIRREAFKEVCARWQSAHHGVASAACAIVGQVLVDYIRWRVRLVCDG